jgi:hypothetical protein
MPGEGTCDGKRDGRKMLGGHGCVAWLGTTHSAQLSQAIMDLVDERNGQTSRDPGLPVRCSDASR